MSAGGLRSGGVFSVFSVMRKLSGCGGLETMVMRGSKCALPCRGCAPAFAPFPDGTLCGAAVRAASAPMAGRKRGSVKWRNSYTTMGARSTAVRGGPASHARGMLARRITAEKCSRTEASAEGVNRRTVGNEDPCASCTGATGGSASNHFDHAIARSRQRGSLTTSGGTGRTGGGDSRCAATAFGAATAAPGAFRVRPEPPRFPPFFLRPDFAMLCPQYHKSHNRHPGVPNGVHRDRGSAWTLSRSRMKRRSFGPS